MFGGGNLLTTTTATERLPPPLACLPVRLSLGGGSVRVGGARATARRSETKTRRKMMEAQKK